MKGAILLVGVGFLLVVTVLWALLDEDHSADPALAPLSPGDRQRLVQPIVVGRLPVETMVRVGVPMDKQEVKQPPVPAVKASDELGGGVRLAAARRIVNAGAGARVVPGQTPARLGEGAQDVPGQPSDGRGEGARIVAARSIGPLGEGARSVSGAGRNVGQAYLLSYASQEDVPETNTVKRARCVLKSETNYDEEDPVPARNGAATRRGRSRMSEKQTAFVPHVPEDFYAKRSIWAAELQKLGVITWSYQVLQISPHTYRVSAYFAFSDGRNLPYSATVQNAYPAAPILVQNWLARNEGGSRGRD